MIWHLDYEPNKQYLQNLFWDNIQQGQWHHSVPKLRSLYWYQIFINDDSPMKHLVKTVEMDLGIYKMNNYPRFSYQLPNTRLPAHIDEDNIVAINLNVLDTVPIIHIENQPYSYESALINVGAVSHSVEPDCNPRLILKFCLRHPFDEVYERLDRLGLIRCLASSNE